MILRFSRCPAVGEHIEEFRFSGQVAESVEEIDEVFKLIESVPSCTAEDGVEYAAGFSAGGTSEEEPVLPADGGQSQHAFGFIVVDGQPAIGAIDSQGRFVIQRILHREVQVIAPATAYVDKIFCFVPFDL